MKPSGPGLLFPGRFLITVSISLLVMDMLRSSISFWFSFGKLYFYKNLSKEIHFLSHVQSILKFHKTPPLRMVQSSIFCSIFFFYTSGYESVN